MTNRIGLIKDYLDQIDFDRDFKNLDEPTREKYQKYIENARKAISNGTIESNEYLDLSRLFGYSGSWDKIFTTEGTPTTLNEEKKSEQKGSTQLTRQ